MSRPWVKLMPQKMQMARRTFMITPAEMTIMRAHIGFARNSHGCGSLAAKSVSKLSSTIPAIFTYPPTGIHEMQ